MVHHRFIDLFAGCGGLSLGLAEAGWEGVFAVEQSPDAFQSFKRNFVDRKSSLRFKWPKWLPIKAMATQDLYLKYAKELSNLQGSIDLIVGGPPCQGFSAAGKRNVDDPRNRLTDEYIKIVKLVLPKYLLLENVRGFTKAFENDKTAYSERIADHLAVAGKHGYNVYSSMLNAADFGIPQPRSRFIMIAVRRDISKGLSTPFEKLKSRISDFRSTRGIDNHKIGVAEAISDLEIRDQKLKVSVDNARFMQIKYTGRRSLTTYQRHMRRDVAADYEPNSLRLANHTQEVVDRFERILKECPRGVTLSIKNREKFEINKQCFTPLHPRKLARTVTTLPDDMIHYKEPRILTVRENARLQSFPDWFEFLGKYTTGGSRRRVECPRYTQVGNAVPPLMAEAIGEMLLDWIDS